jgi:dihydroflavonol-4-reductase
MRLPLVPIDDNELRSGAYWWFYTSEKARRDLGYGTRPLDETLADTIDWLRRDGYHRH